MRYLLILLLFISGAASAQYAPTSAKTAFKWGVSIGTRDSSAYAANDSLVVTINRAGRMMYRSTDGYWKLLANAASSDYVPYTGAVDNVNLGNFRLTASSIRTDSVYANSSAGMYLLTNSGSAVAHWGSGGSVEVDFKGFAGYDANRSASYTVRSFTDKNYVDSSVSLRLRISDTAAMLAPFVQYSDTTGLFSQVVRTFGTQTVGGNKTFSNDISVNGLTVGRGGGNSNSNAAFGLDALKNNTSIFNGNTAIGSEALITATSSTNNTAIGNGSLYSTVSSSQNTAVGRNSLFANTSGSNNTAVGFQAGFGSGSNGNTTGSNNSYFGNNAVGSAVGNSNETVIGASAIGNGSNTVTIGNSSITNNYFNGNIRSSNGTAFLKNMANGSSSDSVIVSNNGELRKIAQSSIVGSGGTVTSVSAGTGMSFTTITSTGAVNADTTVLGTRAFTTGGLVAKANTSLNNVNGVLSSSFGGAGSVNGILKANGSGTVSAVVASDITSLISGTYLPLSGGTLTGALNGTSAAFSGAGSFGGNVGIGTTSPKESFEIAGLNGNIRLYGRSGISQNQLSSNIYYNGSSWVRDNGSYGAVAINLNSSGILAFYTTSATSGFPDERMRINETGNVGIGTTSPVATLESQNASSADPSPLGSVPTTNVFGFSTSPGGMLAGGISATNGTHVWLQGRNRSSAGVSYPISLNPLGGAILINTNVNNGTDALQVAGSGLFAGQLKTVYTSTGSSMGNFVHNTAASTLNNSADIWFGTWGGASVSGITNARISALNVDAGTAATDLLFYTYNGSSSGERLRIASTGAATFSSSVTANGFIQSISTKTANYTLTANDHTVIFDVTAANRTATLPAGVEGRIYVIKIKGSANNINVNPNGSETIEGFSSWTIFGSSCGDGSYTFQFLSGNWYIISSHTPNCL